MTMATVTVVAAVLLINVQFSLSCKGVEQVLICRNIPPYFSGGYSTLWMDFGGFGEINSTVFRSNNLTSVTKLLIDGAGVTGISEGAFSSFQNLRSLILNNNVLTQVNSNWFSHPAVLSELSLTNNQIEIVSDSMLHGFINLSELSLNENRIRTIGPNSFNALTNLAKLDLSGNSMTRVSPRVFRSLGSTKIRLDGNPWDCTCGAEDSVASLKDLWTRSLLDRPMEVTCDSPSTLRGQRVWNVSVCATPPTPWPPSGTQTVHPKPTDALSISVSSARPPSGTKTSVQPKTTDIITTISVNMATYVAPSSSLPPSETKTSVHAKPPDSTTVSQHSEETETCVTSEPPSNTVCTLTAVPVVLCMLLFAACFLVMLHMRKRNNKTVIPGHPREEKNKLEEDGRSSHNQLPGHSEQSDPEMAWRKPFTGPRAKSANAVLLMSSFCVSGEDRVMSQEETDSQWEARENQAEGKQKLVNVAEADGVIQAENLSNTTDVGEKNEKQAGRDVGENPHCVSVNTETVPYLSIGTNPADPNKQSTNSSGMRSLVGKVMGRISTWPPTAVQWQERCKIKEEEEEEEDGSEVFTIWTQKFSSEVNKVVNNKDPPGSDGVQKEGETEKNDFQTAPTINPSEMSDAHTMFRQNDKTISFSETRTHTDVMVEEQLIEEESVTGRQTEHEIQSKNRKDLRHLGCRPAENPARKPTSKTSNKADQRSEAKAAAASRLREDKSTGSKAPSGGTTPDDETLLSGNEYAFMDLLHEVVQNNGRWTRERWKQVHINKQHR